MHNLTFFLICCIVAALFYQSAALRRIKRDESKKQSVAPTKDAANIGKDLVRIRPVPLAKESAKEHDWSKDEALKEKEKSDSTLSSSSPLKHAISSSLASASDTSKHGKLQYSSTNDMEPNSKQNTNANIDGSKNNNLNSENVVGATSTLVKPQQKPHTPASVTTSENNMGLGGGKAALAYLFGKHNRGERFNQNVMEHESVAGDTAENDSSGGGGGAAEVLIIDNSLQPIAYSNNYMRKPNLRSIACNVKRIAELTKSNINNDNNINNNNNYNNHDGVDTAIAAAAAAHNNKINNNNVKDDDMKINKHNDNTNTNSESNNLKRHNNNSNDKSNNNNSEDNDHNNNDNSNHGTCIDRTKKQERKSVSSLLSHSTKMDNNEQKLNQHQQQLQKLHQHDGEHTQQGQQQQQQLLGHLNGKLSSMENVLKFANMLLYKVGLDGAPIHAQGAQVSINSNPTITFAANPSALEGDDFDAIDYFYNTLDTQPALIRSPNAAFVGAVPSPILSATGASGSGTTALMGPPRPFFMQSQYSSNDPIAQPFNFLESALDFLLAGAGGEDDGEDEIELRCPVHHESKKKSVDARADGESDGGAGGGGDPKNDIIQVCSCRFFKKKKNA